METNDLNSKDEKFISPLGHEVTLLEETWTKHIVKYHEDLKTKKEGIKDIVEKPEFISFFKKTNSFNCVKGNFLVSYFLISKNTGSIKTMFEITKSYKDKLKKVIIWRKNLR